MAEVAPPSLLRQPVTMTDPLQRPVRPAQPSLPARPMPLQRYDGITQATTPSMIKAHSTAGVDAAVEQAPQATGGYRPRT